jgi:hypothetical protein
MAEVNIVASAPRCKPTALDGARELRWPGNDGWHACGG